MAKPFLVSVTQVMRHSDYERPRVAGGPLTLRGSATAWRTGEAAGRLLLKNAGRGRKIVLKVHASPTQRAAESAQRFADTFLSTRVGKRHLSTVTWTHPLKTEPRIREFERENPETENLFRFGAREQIHAVRAAWMRGEETGLESRESVMRRFGFLFRKLVARIPEAPNPSEPVQVDHYSTHGWIPEIMLEKLSGKPIQEFGGFFETGEGFAVYTYSNGTKKVAVIRRRDEDGLEFSLE
jgi:broad specificity phosphatase PhoE